MPVFFVSPVPLLALRELRILLPVPVVAFFETAVLYAVDPPQVPSDPGICPIIIKKQNLSIQYSTAVPVLYGVWLYSAVQCTAHYYTVPCAMPLALTDTYSAVLYR